MSLSSHNGSLIGVYHLDEASGNALDALSANDCTQHASPGSVTGKLSTARSFTAASSMYFDHADNATLSMADIDFTVACWVKLTTKPGNMSIVQKAGSNDLEYELRYASAADRFTFRVSSAAGFANITTVTANTFGSPAFATFYLAVAWHDSVNNQLGISINAGTADTTSYTNGSYNSAAAFRMGGYVDFTEYLDGVLDEVLVWKNYVLSSADRTELYNSGAGVAYPFGSAAGPVARTFVNVSQAVQLASTF